MKSSTCRAKNPRSCRYHGVLLAMEDAVQTGDFQAYEALHSQLQQLEQSHQVDSASRATKNPSSNTVVATAKPKLPVTHPSLMLEWDEDKNQELGLDPEKLTRGSGLRAAWKCVEKQHEWMAVIKDRTRGRGCPKCVKLPTLSESEDFAYLSHEFVSWVNPQRTTPLEDTTQGSGEKAVWQCRTNSEHEQWETSVHVRTTNHGCPQCARFDQASLLKNSPKHAHLLTEFVSWVRPDRTFQIGDVIPGSTERAIWKCSVSKHHRQWESSVESRAKNGRGCHDCGRVKLPTLENVPELNHLVREFVAWSDKDKTTPIGESGRSNDDQATWQCQANSEHENWEASVKHRTRGYGCPKCIRKLPKLGETRELSHLIQEFVAWTDETDSSTINGTTQGSEKRATWKCSKDANHRQWESTVKTRASGTGCPTCSRASVSRIETDLVKGIETKGIRVDNQYRVTDTPINGKRIKGFNVDAYLPEHHTVVEYDGVHWHSSPESVERDTLKTLAMLDAGYKVIRIRDKDQGRSLPELAIEHTGLVQLNFERKSKPTAQDLEALVNQVTDSLKNWID